MARLTTQRSSGAVFSFLWQILCEIQELVEKKLWQAEEPFKKQE
jgi:hypothetical protein